MPPLSLVESHNALPLVTIRGHYLRSAPSLCNETHTVILETSSSISAAAFTACYELVRDNMQDMYGYLWSGCKSRSVDRVVGRYKRSDIGWSASRKKKEMKHPAMRFLLLRAKNASVVHEVNNEGSEQGQGPWEDEPSEGEEEEAGKVVGFLSFMVTEEEGEEVLYTYELHLAPNSRNSGLGKHLMDIMEDFGRAVGLGKAMLTCFSENEDGIRFYNRNGYETDVIPPIPEVLRNGKAKQPSYYILSKAL